MLRIFPQPPLFYYAAIVLDDQPIVMWSESIVLSSNYCKNERVLWSSLNILFDVMVWKIPVYHPALVVNFYRINLETLINFLIDI